MAKLSNRCALNHFDASSLLVLLCGSFFFFFFKRNYCRKWYCGFRFMTRFKLYCWEILRSIKLVLLKNNAIPCRHLRGPKNNLNFLKDGKWEIQHHHQKKKSTKLKYFKIKFCWETCSKVYLKNFLFENVCERVYTP